MGIIITSYFISRAIKSATYVSPKSLQFQSKTSSLYMILKNTYRAETNTAAYLGENNNPVY
jgi:hypothetical protein